MPASVQICSVRNWERWGRLRNVRLLLWAVNGWLFSALEERQKKLQQQTALVRAELYRAGISANDGASATARITRETMRYNRQLSEQEARLRRVGEQQRKMHAARGLTPGVLK